jgi:pSer/pThr/pTyr-binding forkhead associated (FHA) protein
LSREALASGVEAAPRAGHALVVVRGPGRGRLLPLGRELLIGRLTSNHLVIDDPEVSRVHARVVAAPDGVHVHDLGSRAGVVVNGRRVHGSARLSDGDELVVGPVALVFTVERGAGA